jgi:hypothetical protein
LTRALPNFVAGTMRSRIAFPTNSSLPPTPYPSAATRRLPPASGERWPTRTDSASIRFET